MKQSGGHGSPAVSTNQQPRLSLSNCRPTATDSEHWRGSSSPVSWLVASTMVEMVEMDDVVIALKEIAKKFGKTDWNFSKDPCSGVESWSPKIPRKSFETTVTCDCSFDNNATCHITAIALKSQNFSAGVPPEFAKFHHLKSLDLSRNYLNGSIPQQWASMRLLDLSFMGNRLSGPFPKVLTRITTLRNLSIEGNNFSGTIPPEIGNLIHLEKLTLSSNAFTGNLPSTFGKLKNLTDMRISDLKGGKSSFPQLEEMESMKTLILRNCMIDGELPKYLGHMKKLKALDLSFNNLTGEIPTSFDRLAKVDFIYLTGNRLTGDVPQWILSTNKNIDVSDNMFSWQSSGPVECPSGSVLSTVLFQVKWINKLHNFYNVSSNLVESYSSSGDTSGVHPCLQQNFPCSNSRSRKSYSLHINCGGKETIISNGTKYEGDLEARGASMFYSRPDWAFSSTGNFMDNDIDADSYIYTNFTPPKIDDEKNIAVGELVGIVAGAVALGILILGILFVIFLRGRKVSEDRDLKGLDLQAGIFTLRQIKAATKNFDAANKVGEGGFGSVYKGQLSDGTTIAVKQLSSKSKQGTREFLNEIGMISALKHPNLVKLYGCCVEGNHLMVIYEYMENNCVSRALFGYMAPEYAMRGYLTNKADVYSFGVVALEIVSGKSNTNYRPKEEFVYLLDWAYVLQERGNILELVDPDLGSNYSSEEAMVVLNVALLCTNASPTLRPTMSQVVSMLQGQTLVQDLLSDPGFSSTDLQFRSMRSHFWQNPSQAQSMSSNGPTTGSDVSYVDKEETAALVRNKTTSSNN
nr:probable LRR receptor-like serine/threonine-protein kinase At1g07650 isoform X1 [Ipomoea batatas]